MANQKRVLSQTEVLISELQNARKILQEESSGFKRIDLEEVKNSIFYLKILLLKIVLESKKFLMLLQHL